MMMPSDKLFTNLAIRSVLGNSLPSLLCTAFASWAIQKRSGSVFPCTDRVTRLLNSNYLAKDDSHMVFALSFGTFHFRLKVIFLRSPSIQNISFSQSFAIVLSYQQI